MPFADELINGYTAQSLTRAIHAALPGAELASLRATAQQLGPSGCANGPICSPTPCSRMCLGAMPSWRESCGPHRTAPRCSAGG